MDKQQKNVYPNQQQSVNYNLVNPLHLPQVPQPHPHAAHPHFYQVPPQHFMMHSPSTYPGYVQPSQHFMMGPPPAYSNTAPSYSIPQPMFHNMATAGIPTGYSVPITPQTAIYDAGARFNGKGPVTIPPPPPGYLPNAAQVAAMQGQTVMVEKKKNNFFTGGKGAGYTFW